MDVRSSAEDESIEPAIHPPYAVPRVAEAHRRIEACCHQVRRELPIDGAGIIVGGHHSSRQLICATDGRTAELEDLQYTLGEGPGIDCFQTGRPVLVPDLRLGVAPRRWPMFAHGAGGIGVGGIFAFALTVRSVPFGTLELYRHRTGTFAAAELATATRLTRKFAQVVLDDLTGPDPSWDPQFCLPVFSRSLVAQASGMISVQTSSSVPDAFARLRACAFAEHRPLDEVAGDVVDRRRRFEQDRPQRID